MEEEDVVIHKRVDRPFAGFRDRSHAGRELARSIHPRDARPCLVLALPRGGIPAGEALAEKLAAPLEPVFARKLPVPDSPEMGFGAVALDGTISLNPRLVAGLGLEKPQIDAIAAEVVAEVQRRAREYSGSDRQPEVEDHNVYMVDDGLATGQSMLAAALMIRKRKPARLVLCVPVSPAVSISVVRPHYDEIHCLIVQEPGSFAVASFYEDFHELSDDEVRDILIRARERLSRHEPKPPRQT